jgi:hypothetical protein
MLQYSFQDLIFSFLVVAAYVALPSVYCALRFYLCLSLFLVLWYSLRLAFVLFSALSTLESTRELFVSCYVLFAPYVGNDLLQASFRTNWTCLFVFPFLVLRLLVSLVSRPGLVPLCRGFSRVVPSLSVRRFLEIWLSSPLFSAYSVRCLFSIGRSQVLWRIWWFYGRRCFPDR